MDTKICTKCGAGKSLAEFSRDARASDALKSECRSCNRASYSVWRAANLAKRLANMRAWKAANAATVSAINSKRRAMKRGATIEAISTDTWAHLHNECAVFEMLCGVPFHIDHVQALADSGGHVASNFDVIPASVNVSKGARRIEDLRPGTIAHAYYHGPNYFEQVTFRTAMHGTGKGHAALALRL